MAWRRMVIVAGMAGALISATAAALDPRTTLGRYAGQSWSTENGLPQNSVHALLQTADGFLWLGTEAGLARFDGYQFKVFDRTSVPALPGDDIRCLLEDRTGGLWVGTASGLTRLKNGRAHTFTEAEGVPGGAVQALVATEDGGVWVLSADGLALADVAKIDAGRTEFSRPGGLDGAKVLSILGDGSGGLWLGTGQGLSRVMNGTVQRGPDALQGVAIDAVARSAGDRTAVYAASARGVFRVENGKGLQVADAGALPAGGVRLLQATARGVWAAGRNSVSLYEGGRRAVFSAGAELPGTQVSSLFEDRRGTVWIGTNGGLCRYLDGRMERVSGSSESVLSLFEDRDGDLWTGTETEGVRVLRDRAFQVLDLEEQSSESSPTSVLQTGDGGIWVGTSGGGVVLASGTLKSAGLKSAAGGPAGETVLALAARGSAKNDLWAGTSNGLYLRHDGRWQSVTSADGLADDLIRSLLAAHDGALWIGTQHGLTRLRDGRGTNMTTQQGLGSNLAGPMLETPDGDLWIGTFGGLSQMHGGMFHNYTVADGLPGNTITALTARAAGGLWIGTKGQGLAQWDGAKFASFAAAPAIPGEIYALLEDGEGSLWITSEHGIFRVAIRDLDRLVAEAKAEVPVVSYGTVDGLPSVDTAAIGYPSAWRLSDGRLCFVTRRGVVVADPAATRRGEAAPPTVLEEVSVDDRSVTPEEMASMAPGPLHFAFSFAGINLSAPQRVQYRYMLDGFDRGWVYAGTRRVAYYTSIPHGRYRFKVSARNELGEWGIPAVVEFDLLPHFYQTVWFRVLLAVFVVLLGLSAYAVRERTLRSQFALVSAERNRLAREIHDTLAQSFVAVSMRLEVMAQLLKSNDGVERCREQLNQTRDLVRESLAEARRSIWDLRSGSEGTDAQTLPARLARVIQETAEQVPNARMETTGTFRPLQRQIEDELYRIAQEAIGNAVRHAGARSIRLRLSYELRALALEVIDDGRGFDPASVPSQSAGHFGLTGIRERAGLIGAEIMLKSVIGEGTTVRVTLPLSRETESKGGIAL